MVLEQYFLKVKSTGFNLLFLALVDNSLTFFAMPSSLLLRVITIISPRHGRLLTQIATDSEGWDGTYNGDLVDPAVFVYHLTIKCIDGQEYFKKGNITVIR